MGLYEDQLAKLKRTEDFTTFWGSDTTQGTATQTDVVQTLLKSGTSGNLETYLKEQGINPKNVPQGWNKPVKQTELREHSVLYGSWTDKPATTPQKTQVIPTPDYNIVHQPEPIPDPFDASNIPVNTQIVNDTGRLNPTIVIEYAQPATPAQKDRTKTIILLGAAAVLILILFVGMRKR